MCQAFRLYSLRVLSYQGTQSYGKFLPQKSTTFWCRVCQPVCGLHLIKPGLCMAAENAASMFLKMVQGTTLWDHVCGPLLQLKTPILFFSCPHKFFHVTPQAGHGLVRVLNTSYSCCLFLVETECC